MSIAELRAVIAVAAAASLAACVGNPAPRGWLAPPRETQSDPYGAWIVLLMRNAPVVAGEFLAVSRDSVYVLRGNRVVAVTTAAVTDARIAYYDSQWGSLATWTTLGSFSTLSNGWFLGLTLPLWLIAGPLSTGGQSRAPMVWLHDVGWTELSQYARFPQGLPPDTPREMPGKTEGDKGERA